MNDYGIEANARRIAKIIRANPELHQKLLDGYNKPNLKDTQARLGNEVGTAIGSIPAIQFLAGKTSEADFVSAFEQAIQILRSEHK